MLDPRVNKRVETTRFWGFLKYLKWFPPNPFEWDCPCIPFLRGTPISRPPISVSNVSAGWAPMAADLGVVALARSTWLEVEIRSGRSSDPQWHAKRTQIFRYSDGVYRLEVDGYWWKLMDIDGSCAKKNCQSSDAKKFPFPPDISLPYSAFEIIRSNTKISQDAQGQWIKIYHYWITTNSDTSTCFRLMKSYEEV